MKKIFFLAFLLPGTLLNAADFNAEVRPDAKYRVVLTAPAPPEWQIRFTDADGNIPLGGILSSRGERYRGAEKNTYVREFYTPHFAKKATLRTKDKVENVRFEAVGDSKYLNLNPEFRLGSENYSGYARTTQSVIRKGADGNYLEVSDSRYGMTLTDPVPVTPGKTYRVSLRREGPGVPKKNIGVYIRFLDKTGNVLDNQRNYWKQSFTFYSNWKNDFPASKQFTAPPSAAFLECLLLDGKFAAFYLTEEKKRGEAR